MQKSILYLSVFLCLCSCVDIVDVAVKNEQEFLVVDAWLNNDVTQQTITLSQTQNYFDNNFTPKIDNATVAIRNNSEVFLFENEGDGKYVWSPNQNQSKIGEVNDSVTLAIQYQNNTYSASTIINRVPIIDSLVQETREGEIFGDGIYAQFYARDPEGLGDSYWIKTYKNDMFLNRPEEINIAFDAGFTAGSEVDGIIFIPPIREAINPIFDSLSMEQGPWIPGDKIKVEIHSISNDAFFFLERTRDQIINGNNGIFAEPIANTEGNISSDNSAHLVLGIFNVAAISISEKIIE